MGIFLGRDGSMLETILQRRARVGIYVRGGGENSATQLELLSIYRERTDWKLKVSVLRLEKVEGQDERMRRSILGDL